MFILHVKHCFFQEIPCKTLLAKKDAESAFLLRSLPANYKIFEVPVLVFARAFGNAVSAVRPWDRGCPGIGCHFTPQIIGSPNKRVLLNKIRN